MTRAQRFKNRQRNQAYVAGVRSVTVCKSCGRQPIEWHNVAHNQQHNSRVGELASQGASLARIAREIAISTPLCRRCHMAEDGRLAAFPVAGHRAQLLRARLACARCGSGKKPFRKGLCGKCYDRDRWSDRRDAVNRQKRGARSSARNRTGK